MPVHVDDAADFILDFLRAPRNDGYPTFGYEFWLPNIVVAFLREIEKNNEHDLHNSARANQLSPIFYDAAWGFCRRGILRPGLAKMQGQATASGASGDGYTLTEFGQAWLAEGAAPVPIEPGRLQAQFRKLSVPFGAGFLQRANESALAYKLGAYLSCCAMCGAASESIFLAVAIAKTGDENSIVDMYRGSQGRQKLLNIIVGKSKAAISEPFRTATGLLSYWRDEAAHGLESTISEIEAHEAVARLLRFAQFTADNWAELTRKAG